MPVHLQGFFVVHTFRADGGHRPVEVQFVAVRDGLLPDEEGEFAIPRRMRRVHVWRQMGEEGGVRAALEEGGGTGGEGGGDGRGSCFLCCVVLVLCGMAPVGIVMCPWERDSLRLHSPLWL